MGIAGAPACLRRHLQSPQDLLGSSCSTQQEVAGSYSGARRLMQDKLIYVAGACGCPAGVCRHACLLAYRTLCQIVWCIRKFVFLFSSFSRHLPSRDTFLQPRIDQRTPMTFCAVLSPLLQCYQQQFQASMLPCFTPMSHNDVFPFRAITGI
jgi:hypothetical protein